MILLRIMRRRSLATFLLVGAFLLGAWGNVIAAAFCPRYRMNRDCCLKQAAQRSKQVEHQSSCHHEMAGVEMDDTEMGRMQMENETPSASAAAPLAKDLPVLTPESSGEQGAFDLPIEACTHCLTHSQTASGTATVITVDPSKRLIETNAPPASFEAPLSAAFSISITPLEHGPPDESLPRHVLVNIFRI
jgi:hypothetical protein